MTRMTLIALACVAGVSTGGEVRAQEGRAACPANHLAVYNPDTYRNDCVPILRGGDKRSQALLDQQRRQIERLRREQLDRSYMANQPTEMLRGEQQWRIQKRLRASR